MKLRKEPLTFALAVLLLGWMAWSDTNRGAGGKRTRGGGEKGIELTDHPAPDLAVALPRARSAASDGLRELFAPPSDTRPLPKLALEPFPEAVLVALAPPPEPTPTIPLQGAFLRTHPTVQVVPGLFAGDEEPLGDEEEFAEDEFPPPAPNGKAVALTPEERAELVAHWKQVYDWIFVGEIRFGRIANADRFAPEIDGAAAIDFLELDPQTGAPRYPGQPPIRYERSRVAQHGYAATAENELEIAALRFRPPIDAGETNAMLALAETCLARRLETGRALPLARELFARVAERLPQDLGPKLGLARVHEAEFDFESAWRIYRSLLADGRAQDPEVLVALASLEARLHLDADAEAHFREAERFGRTSWAVQWPYGRFLLDRGRPREAAEHLELANKHAPAAPELSRQRGAMRSDYGRALVGSGKPDEARDWFQRALQLNEDDAAARAGLAACAVLVPAAGSNGGGAIAAGEGASGFEVLLNEGLLALARGRWHDAERSLNLAAEADPLRAHMAWRALSRLAEITGNDELALSFAERAVEAAPLDAWSTYQRGRLLAALGDGEGALESYLRALDRELDFPEVLAELGRLAHERGDHPSAERYLERAAGSGDAPADVHALRGENLLALGDVAGAETAFRAALAGETHHPLAALGLAWIDYLNGDSQEAITRFAELDDARRDRPEEDPWRTYAKGQIERIRDHEQKVVWSDRFDRTELQNGWQIDEAAGPLIALVDGRARLAGQFGGAQERRTRMYRELAANRFVSLEAELLVKAGGRARAGLFLSREQYRSNANEVQAEVTVSRHPDGNVQTRNVQRGEFEATPYTDHPELRWSTGERVRARIERVGDESDPRVRILVDGVPVIENMRVPSLGRASTNLRFGIFVEGDTGRTVELEVLRVEVVYRQQE